MDVLDFFNESRLLLIGPKGTIYNRKASQNNYKLSEKNELCYMIILQYDNSY